MVQLAALPSSACSQRLACRHRVSTVRTQALFGGKPKTTAAKTESEKAPERKKQSVLSQTLDAFDFAEVRSKSDADLLYEARYGKRDAGGKMTPEQYAALKRKVGGTAKNFFKESVEETQLKTVKIRVSGSQTGGTVPYLPFLFGVVIALLGATAYVVSATS